MCMHMVLVCGCHNVCNGVCICVSGYVSVRAAPDSGCCSELTGMEKHAWVRLHYITLHQSNSVIERKSVCARASLYTVCVLPCTGKKTSPCGGGESGVPGSDSRWRPDSEDCLVMIWDTVWVFTWGEPPRNMGFSWPSASLNTHKQETQTHDASKISNRYDK